MIDQAVIAARDTHTILAQALIEGFEERSIGILEAA